MADKVFTIYRVGGNKFSIEIEYLFRGEDNIYEKRYVNLNQLSRKKVTDLMDMLTALGFVDFTPLEGGDIE